MKQNFYSCLLPDTVTDRRTLLETSSDPKTLQSLYTAYQTVCAVDNLCHSGMGSNVDFSNCLHSGTSDSVVHESDSLRMQLPWLDEMTSMLEDVAVTGARRWQNAVALSMESAAGIPKVPLDLDHFDK